MNIDELVKNYKTYEELKIFTEAQFKQILQLSKRVKELEEKNKELKENKKEIIKAEVLSLSTTNTSGFNVLDDAKTTAQIQIKMLKEQAFERELTLEETKKLEIFNRILTANDEPKDKPIKATAKVLKEDELLSLINGTGK